MSVGHPHVEHPPSVAGVGHPPPVVSPRAHLLLGTLIRLGAFDAASAITDARLAVESKIPEREIIDVRLELLKAGHLVVALVEKPFGSFLDQGANVSPAAVAYLDTLRSRALAIFNRYSAVKRCIENRRIAARPADDRGQATLGLQFEQPRAKRLEAFTR